MVLVETSAIYVGALLMSVVSFLASCLLFDTYHEKDLSALKNLAYFFLFYGIFQFLLGTRLLYMEMPLQQYHVYYILNHSFLYLSLAHFSKFGLFFFRSDWRDAAFWTNISAGAVFLAVMMVFSRPITVLIAVPSLFNWLVLGTGVFVWLGVSSEDVERMKMFMMALGVFLIAVSGPLHNAVRSTVGSITVNLLTVAGTVLSLLGVYMRTTLGD